YFISSAERDHYSPTCWVRAYAPKNSCDGRDLSLRSRQVRQECIQQLSIQKLPDLRPQQLESKRLLQEVGGFQKDAVTNDGVVGIARDNQHLGFRTCLANVVQQSAAVGFGHHNIGDQD